MEKQLTWVLLVLATSLFGGAATAKTTARVAPNESAGTGLSPSYGGWQVRAGDIERHGVTVTIRQARLGTGEWNAWQLSAERVDLRISPGSGWVEEILAVGEVRLAGPHGAYITGDYLFGLGVAGTLILSGDDTAPEVIRPSGRLTAFRVRIDLPKEQIRIVNPGRARH
mgnify:CR=1 FL=1